MIITILSIVNIIFFLLAQASVWRPISFAKLTWANERFAKLIVIFLLTYWTIKLARKGIIGYDKAYEAIYGKDYFSMIRAEFRNNFAALILHQIILLLLALIF